MEWQPIDTAPRDGTPVLLASDQIAGGYQVVASWESDGNPGWECECHTRYHPDAFTHWQRLQAGPGDQK